MDRIIVYPAALPEDTDVLLPEQDIMIAIGYALQASYGNNSVVVGLSCTPTAPASMSVSVGPGGIISPNTIEATPFGSLPFNTTDPLVKMGINTTSSIFTLTAPTTAGQSQNYLLQAAFSEADDTPQTLTYFNSLNPSQPYTGPNNSGTPQNTRRTQRANLQLKVGTPASTGTQVTPPVDTGWIGIWVITLNYGQTAITSSAISAYPNAPFLASFLSSHHGGVPGQAPKINLQTEVQGILPPANLPASVAQNVIYAGNPNGHVAGNAAGIPPSGLPPTLCWDTINSKWWVCITTGTATAAVWTPAINEKNFRVFSASGTFTTPPGVTSLKVTVVGAGGGSSGCSSTTWAGPCGGGGGWSMKVISGLPPSSILVTVGTGGSGSAAGSPAGNGGTSSFGAYCSATGGQGGAQTGGTLSGGAPGAGSGGDFNGLGGYGSDGTPSATLNNWPGLAGSSIFSGAGRCGSGSGVGGLSAGAGASAPYGSTSISGQAGANGVVIVEW